MSSAASRWRSLWMNSVLRLIMRLIMEFIFYYTTRLTSYFWALEHCTHTHMHTHTLFTLAPYLVVKKNRSTWWKKGKIMRARVCVGWIPLEPTGSHTRGKHRCSQSRPVDIGSSELDFILLSCFRRRDLNPVEVVCLSEARAGPRRSWVCSLCPRKFN